MPRRIDAGEVLAAVGGALVFVALFLTWFGDSSGWEAFESLDLVIAALALVAVVAVVASVAGWTSGPSPRVLPWIGAALLVIVAVQLVEPPPVFSDGDPERELGAWLALTGSALVLLGGLLRSSRISVTVSVGGRDVRRRVPAVDRRPGASVAAGSEPGSAWPARSDDAAVSVPPAAHDVPDQATQPFSAVEER